MPESDKKPLGVRLAITPKTYDIDFAGHVSNISYIRWLEDLRLLLLEAYLPLETLMKRGVAPVVLRTTIEYKKAVKLHDEVVGTMWASDMGPVKGILSAEFRVNDIVMATADQIGIFVRMETGRPVAFPEELVRQYQEYVKPR